MHVDIHYVSDDRTRDDAAALADIADFLSDKQMAALLKTASMVREGTADMAFLNFCFSFVGISGYPVAAFCRKHCLAQFRDWMNAEPDAVPVDLDGFPLIDQTHGRA